MALDETGRAHLLSMDILLSMSSVLVLITVSLAFVTANIAYRLFFSPISNVPGPRLAALTYLYEFYYDGLSHGRYLWKIQELHEKYGPIVRVNPQEVHINDASFYDQIYAGGPHHPRDKIRWMAFHDQSTFDTFDADTHRARRAAMAASFSKQAIRNAESLISETIDKLRERMARFSGTEQVMNIKELYSGLTMDIIAQYCFGESMDNLEQEKFGKEFLDVFHEMPQSHPIGRMLPWLFDLIQQIPFRVLAIIDPKLAPMAEYEGKITGQLTDVLTKTQPRGLRTVFHELRDSKQLADSEKTLARFKAEATIFLGAGTETTAAALTTITYHVTANPDIRKKLISELKTHARSSLVELEALPYLNGVIQEGIRLSFGVPGRLPRIAPKEELQYGGFRLPPGTVVSSSSYLLHTNEAIFPDPHAFRPERWLGDRTKMGKHFVPFSRGARMCIGINLAHAELFLTVARVFSGFDFILHETGEEDVVVRHDFFVGMPRLDSKGVRVKIRARGLD